MKYNMEEVKIPKGVNLVEHIQDEKLLFEKNEYFLEITFFEQNISFFNNDKKEWKAKPNVYSNKKHCFNLYTMYGEITFQINSYLRTFNKKAPGEQNLVLPTIAEVVESLGFENNSRFVSGQISDYFLQNCVVTYAKIRNLCYMIIKTKRGLYKGYCFITTGNLSWHNKYIEVMDIKETLEAINELTNNKIEYKELSEEEKITIVSKMV